MPIQDFSKVELLLPMVGANNGTEFTDYSLRQRTVTRLGGTLPTTVTAQSKFAGYGSSGLFPQSSGHQARLGVDIGAAFGANDFFIGVYVRPGSADQVLIICDNRAGAGFDSTENSVNNFALFLTASGVLTLRNNTATWSSLSTYTSEDWAYVSLSRCGNTWKAALDGTVVIIQTISSSITSPFFNIGGFAGSLPGLPDRYFQDLIIVSGDCVYSGDFTPPPRMTQRTLTRVNTGADSDVYDRAMLFDWNGSAYPPVSETPDSSGDFAATDLIDLEYGVALIKDGCDPVCRGPVLVDPD